VLIGIAEVVGGTELVDHEHGSGPVACADHDGLAPAAAPGSAASAAPSTSLASDRPVPEAAPAQASRPSRRPAEPSAATKSEMVRVRPGRWILVRKTDRTLSIYEADRRLKTYPIVLGADPVHPKLYEGDRRTPEGEYHIVSKHDHPEWHHFLLLDYPNADNLEAYTRSRAKGLLPARGGKVPGAGGAVGIHGTKDDGLNRKGVNWTHGCISLLNRDIRELYETVPVGTPVVIER
jgi:murein L,D-transpeptidase YafK